jgi:ribonuclease Z
MSVSTSPLPDYMSSLHPPALPGRPRSPLPARTACACLALLLVTPAWADEFYPLAAHPATNQMRISFLGTSFIPRLSQAANSVFVECGPDETFIFDCGAGVVEKFVAMGVPYSRMDKVFLTHLHGDHMSDLTYIYCFGPANDRKTPLYVWGPAGPDANSPEGLQTDEGTIYFCEMMKEYTKWHRNSFSFLPTGLTNGVDGYDLIATECPYDAGPKVVYNTNGVTITCYPAVHDRDGALGYVLRWKGLSMSFSGDTRPNAFTLSNATNLDVFIHEVTLPPELWAQKNGVDTNSAIYPQAVAKTQMIVDCSHTPSQAFGYMLYQMHLNGTAPRLAVATHCQFEADTTNSIMTGIRSCYAGDVTLAKGLLVITVDTDKRVAIQQVSYANMVSPDAYTRSEGTNSAAWAPPKYANNMMQFSTWLTNAIIPEALYTNIPGH